MLKIPQEIIINQINFSNLLETQTFAWKRKLDIINHEILVKRDLFVFSIHVNYVCSSSIAMRGCFSERILSEIIIPSFHDHLLDVVFP